MAMLRARRERAANSLTRRLRAFDASHMLESDAVRARVLQLPDFSIRLSGTFTDATA